MSKILDWPEKAVATAVGRMSGPVVGAVAATCYAGLGLVLPLALHRSAVGLAELNVVGTSIAAVVLVAWIAVRVEANHRRHLVEWTTELRNLDSSEFEWLVGEVFRREGWSVRETGSHDGPDGNIDLQLSRNRDRVIVQCKRWTSWPVSVDDVRAFGGTLLREGLGSSAGIFVTLSRFTSQARDEAEQMGLLLVDGPALYARVERVRNVEPCPVCDQPMKLSRSAYGWWFRCVAQGCGGKRDLANDPGRAVELLTETP